MLRGRSWKSVGKVSEPIRFLDTSVLIRYLTNDLPAVAVQARQLIESEPLLQVPPFILAETAWVLGQHYGVPRDHVIEAIVQLVLRENIQVGSHDRYRVREALLMCAGSGRTSLRDALLWLEARQVSGVIYTCDRRFPSAGIHVELLGAEPGS